MLCASDVAIGILRRCPRLVSCKVDLGLDSQREALVTLPRLRSFALAANYGRICGPFLDSLSLPALQTLRLFIPTTTSFHHLDSFISRHSNTLVSLILSMKYKRNVPNSILNDAFAKIISSHRSLPCLRDVQLTIYESPNDNIQDPRQETGLWHFLQLCHGAGMTELTSRGLPPIQNGTMQQWILIHQYGANPLPHPRGPSTGPWASSLPFAIMKTSDRT